MMLRFAAILLALSGFLAFGSAGTAMAEGDASACAKLRQACMNAGFSKGKGGPGEHLMKDCVTPLLNGKTKVKRAAHELPQIADSVIEACLAEQGNTGGANAAQDQPVALARSASNLPNIVLVLADDLSMDLISTDPATLRATLPNIAKMKQAGASFVNFFTTESLCCPSRASIFI